MKTVKKTLARKLILIIFCLLSLVSVQAQDSKTIDLTVPGTLRDSLSTEEINSLIRLTVTGSIDARDFRTMRDEMPLLAEIDLSDVEITAYEGNEGTLLYNTLTYPANEIPFWAFHDGYTGIGKTSLTTLIYPSSTVSVAKEAFSDCYGLTSAILPASVKTIGAGAYMYCAKLGTVILPEGVQTIGEGAFKYCISLEALTIPSTVREVEGLTFASCERLSSLVLSEGVQLIGEGAFSQCVSLESVTIPSSVITIGDMAFGWCSNARTLTLPEGVGFIGQSAFGNCTSLDSVSIPSSVRYLGMRAFYYCSALTSIKAGHTTPLDLTQSPDVFEGVNKSSCTLYVPYESKSLYTTAPLWEDFLNMQEWGEPVLYPDIIADKGAPSSILDLKAIFNDASITGYTVTSNTNPQVVTADITGSSMTLNFSTETTGISELVVTATSNEKVAQLILMVEVKLPTTLSDLEEQQVISVYPNPTRGAVNVKINRQGDKGKRYRVSDPSGRMIYQSVISNELETFNLKGNPSGMYFLKIEGEVKEVYKIILE